MLVGTRPDGTLKIRAVDNFTASMCNKCTIPTEKLKYETLDIFFNALRLLVSTVGDDLGIWKADVDSAFRRVPIKPEHRGYACVAFKPTKDVIAIAQHMTMPFGSIGSVHGWDRIGCLLTAIARRILKLPLLRFVDDFFSGERSGATRHAMLVFAR